MNHVNSVQAKTLTFRASAAVFVREKELDHPSVTRTATFLASCLAPRDAAYSVVEAWFSPAAVSVPPPTVNNNTFVSISSKLFQSHFSREDTQCQGHVRLKCPKKSHLSAEHSNDNCEYIVTCS